MQPIREIVARLAATRAKLHYAACLAYARAPMDEDTRIVLLSLGELALAELRDDPSTVDDYLRDEPIVRDLVRENPELILEALSELEGHASVPLWREDFHADGRRKKRWTKAKPWKQHRTSPKVHPKKKF